MIDVSLVVAVYNPGDAMDDLLESLDAQTHPRDRWEAILVDDGSTDGTGERLDEWCAARPGWTRVEHIENSGWPSRPRNIGTDLARGEFVLYADNDDWLDREAIATLHRRATRTDADVVVGKVVGHGKKVPRELFERSRKEVTVDWPPLVRLLSPHKLFRRSLLAEHGIRFPEGRVRLEDHAFVMSAFFAARRISVGADRPVYHWMRRESGNQSFSKMDAEQYFGRDVPRVLDVIDANVPEGDLRDQLYTHWWRSKGLWRLQGGACHNRELDHNLEIYAAVRRLMQERFPERLDHRLPYSLRVLAQLVREERTDAIWALAEYEAKLFVALRMRRSSRPTGTEVFKVVGRFGNPHLRLRHDGDRLLWAPPEALARHLDGVSMDVTNARHSIEVIVRRDSDLVEHVLPARTDLELEPVKDHDDLLQPAVKATARLNRRKAASGTPLPAGEWSVGAQVRFAGFAGLRYQARVWEDGVLGERGTVRVSVAG